MASPPSDSIDSKLFVQRKRASTNTSILLGSDYQDPVIKVFGPPKPGKTASDYDEEHLRAGLRYADSTLRCSERKLSPLGERAVRLYKRAVSSLLELETIQQASEESDTEIPKEEWLSVIRTHEMSCQYRSCLTLTDSQDSDAMRDAIINLQRIAFFARYGDVYADACQRVRKAVQVNKPEGWENLTKRYWTDIKEQLEEEGPYWDQVHQGIDVHDKCLTHLAISRVCHTIGFNVHDVVTIVQSYAKRNEIVHADIWRLIKQGDFDDLKRRLSNDYVDIKRVIPEREQLQTGLLKRLLQNMIDRWFVNNPNDPGNIQSWMPTPELLETRDRLQKKISSNVSEQTKETIAIEAAKTYVTDKASTLVDDLEDNFGIRETKAAPKRLASADIKVRVKRMREWREEWEELNGMVHGARRLSTQYKKKYGDLVGPPVLVVDPSMDSDADDAPAIPL